MCVLPIEQFADNVVEAGSEVVDCITNAEGDLDRGVPFRVDPEHFASLIKVRLHADFAEIGFQEIVPVRYRFLNAMIGPFAF
jgi:hypothetical protein